jgi:prevent-host-death family protein
MMHRLSSREFNQDTGGAKKAAEKGPVIITDRGTPSHVLLSFDDYQRLIVKKQNILELLACPEADPIEFDYPTRRNEIHKPVDLS